MAAERQPLSSGCAGGWTVTVHGDRSTSWPVTARRTTGHPGLRGRTPSRTADSPARTADTPGPGTADPQPPGRSVLTGEPDGRRPPARAAAASRQTPIAEPDTAKRRGDPTVGAAERPATAAGRTRWTLRGGRSAGHHGRGHQAASAALGLVRHRVRPDCRSRHRHTHPELLLFPRLRSPPIRCSGDVAVGTKSEPACRWNLAAGLGRRGRVASGHDVAIGTGGGRIATVPSRGVKAFAGARGEGRSRDRGGFVAPGESPIRPMPLRRPPRHRRLRGACRHAAPAASASIHRSAPMTRRVYADHRPVLALDPAP